MQQLIEFILRHWELCLAFLVILGLLLTFELHLKLTGASPVSVQQAVFFMNREEAIFLDVRDAKSFKKEHVADSINIPFSELAEPIKQLEGYDRNRPILINFIQGQSHHRVARLLKKAGFTRIYFLQGGIASWKAAALPLATQ